MDEEKFYKRISDCEVLMSKYHDQLMMYVAQVVNYNNQIVQREIFDSEILKVDKGLEKLYAEIADIKTMCQAAYRKSDAVKSEMESYIESKVKRLPEVHENLIRLNNQVTSLLEMMNIHSLKLSNLEPVSLDIVKIKAEIQKMVMAHSEFESNVFKHIDLHSHMLHEFKISKNHESEKVNLVQKELEDLRKELQRSSQGHRDLCESVRKSYQGEMQSLESRIQSKICTPKEPTAPALSGEQVQKICESVVEKAFSDMRGKLLDLENAVLRSANNEMHLKLLEKKLENLSLQFKNRMG